MKTCSTCKELRAPTDFHRSRSTRDGLDPRCRTCRKTAGAIHVVDLERKRAGHNLRIYGITREQYDALLVEQDGACAICRQPETMTYRGQPKALSVDHDHETSRVRGLLCAACNFALGKMQDNPARLRAAADYLER